MFIVFDCFFCLGRKVGGVLLVGVVRLGVFEASTEVSCSLWPM